MQFSQKLKPTDHTEQKEFVEWTMEQQKVDVGFSNKIIFSDEAHFHLDVFVNLPNYHIRRSENPGVIVENK